MNTENGTKQDCGCDNGECCQPKKSNKWTKIIFALILLTAVAIIVAKFTYGDCKKDTCAKTTDTTGVATKDSTAKPCCPNGGANCGDKTKN
jgi:hypothetical protein